MLIQENFSLRKLNTFGIDATARYFVRITNKNELLELLEHKLYRDLPVFWLGGGSNILLTKDFEGLAVKLALKGLSLEHINDKQALLGAAAGENWHETVRYSLDQELGGLENLSLIPGQVGTAPMQNIGAYGVELKDSFYDLEALDLKSGQFRRFNTEECQFDYRYSYFKGPGKGRYVITEVRFLLSRKEHQLRLDYGAIKAELANMGLEPSIHSVSQAVINIRSSKLPDPAEIGNSGSFFKNPIVQRQHFEELKQQFPEIVAYPVSDNQVKLAAGWLIEKAGWKGFRRGDAGVHQKQALVLVNYGKATGEEIKALSKEIQGSIFSTFAVRLEPEVNFI
jgi:UDP-N-acetylmuramate dehydrogenase